jgi:gamma-glutamylputrescine oxidase
MHRARYTEEAREEAALLNERYDYPHARFVGRDEIRAMVASEDFHSGVLDTDAAHLHPLNYALGLAKAAAGAGVRLHERSRVTRVTQGRVETAAGTVSAPHILLACNGYLCGLAGSVARHVMPINNFIVATEPLDDPRALIRDDVAVADSRFVVNYFRLSQDGRLLFGGGESYGYRFPADIAAKVRKPMRRLFPQLADTRIEYAWGGTLGITMDRMPHFAKVSPGILSISGYSGHGVGMATLAGKLAAEAIAGQAERFEVFATLPRPQFPGGARVRTPLLALAMVWYGLRDRL